jgi:hypothetical protein
MAMCIKNENTYDLCPAHVCIEDVCGSCWHGGHIEYFADWCPNLKLVLFGGAWWDVPPMLALTEPNAEAVNDHAAIYDGFWFNDAKKYAVELEKMED